MTIEPWELWWAEVEYEYHEGSKRRPVLVVSADEVYVLSYKITSHLLLLGHFLHRLTILFIFHASVAGSHDS